jgi:puromycin-sensitive aminopeptidase
MPDHRLPRDVLPRHYDLEMRPDLEGGTFSGSVSIHVEVIHGASRIVLNSVGLSVGRATITDSTGPRRLDVEADVDNERIALSPEGGTRSGTAIIELDFTGSFDDRLRGLYRSTLTNSDGTTDSIATTQFQSTDARRAFPCFDEPDMKATFAISLVAPEGLLAISNGAELSRAPLGDGTDRVVFEETIPLSTYLVAFVVGPLEATDPVDVDGTPVRVIHPPGKGHLTSFALEVAAHSLRWFQEWYDIDVPGGKVDLVALPDFAFGAMENLGCITFREILLLVDPGSATQAELERVAAVLSHELAHLWFGDLVTMEWWNGIWLNEAFATFMEMKAVESYRPDWNVWTGFGSARSAALDVDSLASTRPIEYPVVTPADAEGMFDLLTYEKGAAVVRMLEQYLGAEAFRDGVRHYLKAHLYGNTRNEDLWDALEETTGEPVRSLMDGWIFTGGHPLLKGSVDGRELTLAQKPFRYDGVDNGTRWTIPVHVRTSNGSQRALLPPAGEVTVQLDGDLLTLNADASGFHRSDPPATCDPGLLSAAERAAVLDDTWALVLAGATDPHQFHATAARFVDDPDLGVWQAIVRALSTIDLVAPSLHMESADAAGDLLTDPLSRLGWTPGADEDGRTRQLRGLVLSAAGTLADDAPVIAEARSRWVDNRPDDPAVAAAVVAVVAAHGDEEAFNECRRRFLDADNAQDEQRHLFALAGFPGRTQVGELLEMVLTGGIRSQDAPFLIRQALHHRHHRGLVWQVLTGNWGDLTTRLPSNSIARMLEGVRALVDPDLSPGVEAFLDGHPVPQGALMVAQHRERRLVNMNLARRL